MNNIIDFKKERFIRPLTILNKEKYYFDLGNIENSYSGFIDDGYIINTFILEAVQLLIHAIELFEQGYFDCAYYSLRSAIDVSTTMIYFTDMPDQIKEKNLKNGKNRIVFLSKVRWLKRFLIMELHSLICELKCNSFLKMRKY